MVCGRKATSAHIQKGLAPNPAPQPIPNPKKRSPIPSRGNDGAGPSQPVVKGGTSKPSQKEKGKAKARPEPDVLDMTGNENTVATPNVWPVADAPGRIERTGEKQRTLNLSQFPKARQTVIHNLVMKGDSTGLPHFTGGAGGEWHNMVLGGWMGDNASTTVEEAVNQGFPRMAALNGYETEDIKNGKAPFSKKVRTGGPLSKLSAKDGCNKIIFQENRSNIHWRTLVFDKDKRTIETWDSLPPDPDVDVGYFTTDAVKKWIEENNYGTVDRVVKKQVNKQGNAHSCGAYSALFSLSSALDKQIPKKISDQDCREFIGNVLIGLNEINDLTRRRMPDHTTKEKREAYYAALGSAKKTWLDSLSFRP